MTTDRPERKRKPAPQALASRILAVGVSAAATIGLVGAIGARPPEEAKADPSPVTRNAERPIHIVVVVRRTGGSSSGGSSLQPRIVRRYVPGPAATSSHGS